MTRHVVTSSFEFFQKFFSKYKFGLRWYYLGLSKNHLKQVPIASSRRAKREYTRDFARNEGNKKVMID